MKNELINAVRLDRARLKSTLDSLPAGCLTAQLPGARNHALWTLGHLAHSMEAIGGELGLKPWLPSSWARAFRPGSTPSAEVGDYPPLQELRAALEDGIERVLAAFSSATEDQLAGPLPDARYRSTYASLGHAVLHIVTSHFAYHVGQLACWAGVVQRDR